ncbi:MAG TPA: hypothetical protein DDW52_25030 [Planctomycetaceae bacterium]|nr:hypothetical protein [Planctomycetaceae bacterium]
MQIQTSRFGQIEAGPEDIIIFPQGLIGFESSRQWLILPDPENPDVAWLQSVAQPQVALPLVSPRKFAPEYKVNVPNRQLSTLQIRSSDRIYVLNVVSKSGKTLTVNLRSPVVINLSKRTACQVITTDSLPLALPIDLDNPTSNVKIAA